MDPRVAQDLRNGEAREIGYCVRPDLALSSCLSLWSVIFSSSCLTARLTHAICASLLLPKVHRRNRPAVEQTSFRSRLALHGAAKPTSPACPLPVLCLSGIGHLSVSQSSSSIIIITCCCCCCCNLQSSKPRELSFLCPPHPILRPRTLNDVRI